MAVNYKLYQSNREGKSKGKWYARAVHNQVVDTNALAEIMQRNCTLKKSDIQAVLTELVEIMQDQLQASRRVRLNGLGSFKINIHSTGAESAKDFSVSKNVSGVHVVFQPEAKVDANTRKHQRVLLNGTQLIEADAYTVDKSATGTEEGH